jgi:FMN phosphatase YigB (HAD superfamily)
MALERLGSPAESCLMIGDRPDTDIAGAAAIGMPTALVRTGRFPPGEPWPEGLPRPDWDVADLQELRGVLGI